MLLYLTADEIMQTTVTDNAFKITKSIFRKAGFRKN